MYPVIEHNLRRKYKQELTEFFALSAAGGDRRVETYGRIGDFLLGLQAKWFKTVLAAAQIKEGKDSVITAKNNRPEIVEYIICLSKRVNSIRAVAGGKVANNTEPHKLASMEAEINKLHHELRIIWWFENVILEELRQPDCLHIEPYWFGKNLLPLEKLRTKFSMQLDHE